MDFPYCLLDYFGELFVIERRGPFLQDGMFGFHQAKGDENTLFLKVEVNQLQVHAFSPQFKSFFEVNGGGLSFADLIFALILIFNLGTQFRLFLRIMAGRGTFI